MKQRLIIFSFILSVAILVAKFYAYYLSGANTQLTDALESIINVVAAIFAYYSIYLASLPRDLNHPYGHGKIEFFASGLEGVLILLAAVYIFLHAFEHFFSQPTYASSIPESPFPSVSALANGILGFYLIKQGKSSHSPALTADGKHLTLDAYNGILVVVALSITDVTSGFGWIRLPRFCLRDL
jgi:cation diffusion facilitator family transporter